MVEIAYNLELYKVPSDAVLQNRKKFYNLRREEDEKTKIWLDRVENCINCCEFPKFVIYLLIDKFIGELDTVERENVRAAADTWSLRQIFEHFSHPNVGSHFGAHRNETVKDDLLKTPDQSQQIQLPLTSPSAANIILKLECVSKFEKKVNYINLCMLLK